MGKNYALKAALSPRERVCFLCMLPHCSPCHPLCVYAQLIHPADTLAWTWPLLAVMAKGEIARVRFGTFALARRAETAIYRTAETEGWTVDTRLRRIARRVVLSVRRCDDCAIDYRYTDRIPLAREEHPMRIRVAKIDWPSDVNGPGRRVVVYVQGCPLECPGCQNAHLWAFDGPDAIDLGTAQTARRLLALQLPITISGGEPFAQPEALWALIGEIRVLSAKAHIIVYTGLGLEDLVEYSAAIPEIARTLRAIDVLVDGPFVAELDDDHLQYRGSRNQRPIDMPATLAAHPHILDPNSREPAGVVILDWDTPELTVTPEGDVTGTAGLIEDLFGEGAGDPAPMCGQTRGLP